MQEVWDTGLDIEDQGHPLDYVGVNVHIKAHGT